jgi:hypothetical protein
VSGIVFTALAAAALSSAGNGPGNKPGLALAAPSSLTLDAAARAGDNQPAAEPAGDDGYDTDPAEPDFEVVTLPTNLRLPRGSFGMRVTHRFSRPLGEGDFGDLAADLFGLDGGSQVGLGLRFGLFAASQLGIYRTNDRTIAFEARQALLREGRFPLGLSLRASVEGLDNFSEERSPAIALVVSRRLGTRGAVYLEPAWVGNTHVVASAPGNEDATLVLAAGARLRLSRRLYLVGELHPRLAGYRGDLGSGDPDAIVSFGLESRVGGHSFQLNFSNAQGTTPAQLARGAQGVDGWFIGFNLTRKFY